ncbi:REP-associated tyrosine transposase [Denitromonas sp.]|uniref:REP-associated tyrosine transposase n=1 Tax=Denitromonas sp. TaxID=2734609 RepID=UPI002AFF0229|nr:transposase [Denitromonas sp.]
MSNYRRDRTPGGMYFFTVTLADRRSALLLTQIDRFRAAYRAVIASHPVNTVAICVLPDHIHAVWQLPDGDDRFSLRWRLIKHRFSYGLPAALGRSASKIKHREAGIWQRRFWEHRILNATDLQRHVDYIHFNPVKHGLVDRVKDWPFSSFHRYVATGCLPPNWGGGGVNPAEGDWGE